MKKFTAGLRKYVPGAGMVLDAFTGKPITDAAPVVHQSRPGLLQQLLGLLVLTLALALAMALFTGHVMAQTDITSTVSMLSGYWTAIATLAITIVLFVLGRKLLRKV